MLALQSSTAPGLSAYLYKILTGFVGMLTDCRVEACF